MSSRFGKRKDDKSKDAAKMSKNKLEALSEEELDRLPNSRDGYGSEAGGTRLCVGVKNTEKKTKHNIKCIYILCLGGGKITSFSSGFRFKFRMILDS